MKKVSKSLTAHLARLTELVTRIENSDKKTAQIDIDILLDELREMYDYVYRMPAETEEAAEERPTEPETEPAEAEASAPAAETEPAVASVSAAVAITESAAATEPEPATEAGQQTETTPEMAVLMVDNEAEPVFAEEPETAIAADNANSQPTMEELEGQPNDELFAEEAPHAVEEPQAQPVPTNEEQPKTLWEKLQGSQSGSTIAEKIGSAKSISDLMEEKAAQQKEAVETVVAETVSTETVVAETVTPIEEPAPETAAAETAAPQAAAEETTAAQPSLFDYFKSSAQDTPAPRTLADTLGEKAAQAATANNTNPRPDRVHDLRTIININDKFSFMNELFHNNMKGYNDFILRLNAIDNREEAQTYVDSIASQYSWDNESMTVKTFYSIFNRKF